jgi:hypothetical protein
VLEQDLDSIDLGDLRRQLAGDPPPLVVRDAPGPPVRNGAVGGQGGEV